VLQNPTKFQGLRHQSLPLDHNPSFAVAQCGGHSFAVRWNEAIGSFSATDGVNKYALRGCLKPLGGMV
jgi:hypothetical protein